MPILTLPYPPSANRLWRSYGGRMVKAPAAVEYQRTAQICAMQAGIRPSEAPIALDVTLHPKKPKSSSTGLVRSIDVSNAIKCAEDALNGVAWIDDRQVQELHARRGHPIDGGALIVRWSEIDVD